MTEPLEILLVSDATGSTAEAVVTSTLVQFGHANVRLTRHPFTRSMDQVREIVEEAPPSSVVVYTFVSSDLSEAMQKLGGAKGLTVIDLLGPLMAIFAEALQSIPMRTPGALHRQTEDMFKVIEAIHYTLRHDDGEGLETVDEANLVILGVSRTGKTPTSIFLSCRKLKVANVPIIRDFPLAEELRTSKVPKVGFLMDIERQVQVRSERTSRMGTHVPGYAERRHIAAEIDYCNRLYRTIPGIRTVNVTNRSIEETSDWITHNVI
jgi:regulator of PEP synthase PpsR (kinase-PPPase family)